MLTLTRKAGERILVGDDVEITIVEVSGGKVRVGISAPRTTRIHRAEVLARVIEENHRASHHRSVPVDLAAHALTFEGGLPGLAEHTSWVLAELGEDGPIRALVSLRERAVQLLVVEASVVVPDYPVERALRGALLLDPELAADEDVAVALVTTVPRGGARASVNLLAPIVLGLSTRRGVQVVLEGSELPVRAELEVSAASRASVEERGAP